MSDARVLVLTLDCTFVRGLHELSERILKILQGGEDT